MLRKKQNCGNSDAYLQSTTPLATCPNTTCTNCKTLDVLLDSDTNHPIGGCQNADKEMIMSKIRFQMNIKNTYSTHNYLGFKRDLPR